MIFTIGHSTHSANDFLTLLRSQGVRQVADVRTVPRSARHPQFQKDTLADFLAAADIGYAHFPDLGGLRKPLRESVNIGWRHSGFRGYADYMQTEEFRRAIGALEQYAEADLTAVMCAEALWWKCHRRLIADALIVRGVPVQHIMTVGSPKPHELSEFARVELGSVTYPGLL